MKGMQNASLADAVLRTRPKILIYSNVNSGFSPLPRLASPALGRFAWSFL
jgi:hypothetical protein